MLGGPTQTPEHMVDLAVMDQQPNRALTGPPPTPDNPGLSRFNPYQYPPPLPPKRGRGRPRKSAPPPTSIEGRPIFGPPRPPTDEDEDLTAAEALGLFVQDCLQEASDTNEDPLDEEPDTTRGQPRPPTHSVNQGPTHQQNNMNCPPTPSPPGTEDEFNDYVPDDIDMDEIELLLGPSQPVVKSSVTNSIANKSSLQFWQSIQKKKTPQGILISHQDQKTLTTILQQESLSIRQLAQQQEKFEKKIELFMMKLESKIDNVQVNNVTNPNVPAPILQPPSVRQPNNPWNNVNNKSRSKNTAPSNLQPITIQSTLPPRAPSNQFINQFKPSSFIIRKIPETTPFENKSSEEIVKITNNVLKNLNAQTSDKTPIQIRAVTTLKSGDIKFFVQSRAMTSWLLTNKHTWTHHCDPSLITRPLVFPVIIHSVPTSFSPTSTSDVQELCQANSINLSSISNIRWLGNPSTKTHGSLVISFLAKPLASQIEKGGLFFQSSFM